MSRIDSTTITSGSVNGAAPVDGADGTDTPSAASLLPEPDAALALSGDPGAELAALMVKNGNRPSNGVVTAVQSWSRAAAQAPGRS